MYIAGGDDNARVEDQLVHWVIFTCVLSQYEFPVVLEY